MKTKNDFKVGDILFSVDPLRLRVTKFSITEIDPNLGSVVVTAEKKGTHPKSKHIHVDITMSDFPMEHNKLLYFKCEDEANKFVKTQIGM